jgi:hypothetical protein
MCHSSIRSCQVRSYKIVKPYWYLQITMHVPVVSLLLHSDEKADIGAILSYCRHTMLTPCCKRHHMLPNSRYPELVC